MPVHNRPSKRLQAFHYIFLANFDILSNMQLILALCAMFRIWTRSDEKNVCVLIDYVTKILCWQGLLMTKLRNHPSLSDPKKEVKKVMYRFSHIKHMAANEF